MGRFVPARSERASGFITPVAIMLEAFKLLALASAQLRFTRLWKLTKFRLSSSPSNGTTVSGPRATSWTQIHGGQLFPSGAITGSDSPSQPRLRVDLRIPVQRSPRRSALQTGNLAVVSFLIVNEFTFPRRRSRVRTKGDKRSLVSDNIAAA
jgi:hypothetical protein